MRPAISAAAHGAEREAKAAAEHGRRGADAAEEVRDRMTGKRQLTDKELAGTRAQLRLVRVRDRDRRVPVSRAQIP
jgi:hypothetical protein